MVIRILCGAYGFRSGGRHVTVYRGERCDVPEKEAIRLIEIGAAEAEKGTEEAKKAPSAVISAYSSGVTTFDEKPNIPSSEEEKSNVGENTGSVFSEESLMALTVAELKAMAAEKGIRKKFRNKSEIVSVLLGTERPPLIEAEELVTE